MRLDVLLSLAIFELVFASLHSLYETKPLVSEEVLQEQSGYTYPAPERRLSLLFKKNDANTANTGMMADLKTSPQPSPLDSMSIAEENNIHPKWLTGEELAAEVNTLPKCQRKCVKSLYNAIAKMMKTHDYIEKYRNVCRTYKKATVCIAEEHRRCGESDEMFNVISSGMKYVCVEQRNAFNSFISCINREAHSIQSLCEDECSYHNHLFNILTRLSLASDFGELLEELRRSSGRHVHAVGVTPVAYKQGLPVSQDSVADNTRRLIKERSIPQIDFNSLRTFEDVIDQACVYGECALGCLRNKFNMKCEENVGSLISEALIRPLVEGHQKFSPLFIAFGVIAPKSCSFLYKGSSLLKHRIDPEVHDAVLKKYGKAVDTAKTLDDADKSSNAKDIFGFRSIDAESDLEHLINIIYGNGTLNEVQISNVTFAIEDHSEQQPSRHVLNLETTLNRPENISFDMVSEEGSGHLDEVVVFRAILPTETLTFDFTPNVTGTLQCRLIPMGTV